MTAKHNDVPPQEHETVFELLPWYAEGTLNPDERAMTEKHLARCAVCRAELEHYRQLVTAFDARAETEAWQPSEAHFDRLLAMIDAIEPKTPTPKPEKLAKPRRFGLGALSAWFGDAPAALRWTLGIETLALAALMLALVIPHPPGESEEWRAFETLTSAAKPEEAVDRPRLHVVFAGEITEAEIRSLLQAVHGQLVEGPSSIGVYTVELASATAAGEAVGQAAQTLRADPKVRLAEPVPGGTAP